jgi:hypothetical protein
MAMVLLPIGGLSHYAQADMHTAAGANTGGWPWLGVGMVPEPGAMGLVLMGGLWLFLRGYGRYCRGGTRRD